MAAYLRRDVFQAIADPVRREIISLVAAQPMNLNAIADKFDISRPAISNHIKILAECGIILATQVGRERMCEVKLDRLNEVTDWVNYCQFWNKKFDSLEQFINNNNKTNGK